MKRSFLLFLFSVLFISSNHFSQSNFNIQLYQQFLTNNQNLEPEALMQMHPAGSFIADLDFNFEDARYFDSIDVKYNLTAYEKSLINQHGFMVSERLSKISFGQAILEIFHSDLPVFISTDAILHAFHVSYNRILRDVEMGFMVESVKQLLLNLRSKQDELHNNYATNPDMLTMLKDVDVYITIALRLIDDENTNPYYADNSTFISECYNKVIEAGPAGTFTIFSDNCKVIDWSQFKPRGHYDDPERPMLANYFRTMMWLGRMEIYLIKPVTLPVLCEPQTFEDIQRQTIDAFLIRELFNLSDSYDIYSDMEQVLEFFVGEQDNVTLNNLDYLADALTLSNPAELLDSLRLIEFQDTLKNQAFAYQLILSQILYSSPMGPDSIVPASAYLMFGQRFVIDSYVSASVVFDKIRYYGQKICRLLPQSLDVMFAVGNDASAQLLVDELNEYKYSTNLAALRYLIDAYDDEFWESSVYNFWLKTIRTLNPELDRTTLPPFMQTAAFWQQKMNTQLSSWTELRHDNLLYAKQSYTGGTVCSYPYSYVEPFPEFYTALKDLSTNAITKFNQLNFNDPWLKLQVTDYFNHLYSVSDTLGSISVKHLNGELLTNEEILFLQTMLYDIPGASGEPFQGWYPKLFYKDPYQGETGYEGLMNSDHIVADVHTVPTDCFAIPVGWVKHVGTGPVNLAVVVTEWNDGINTAFVGPVMSYYEYTTSNFLRLTDQEWDDTYLQSALRPEWVNLYLADSSGNSRGEGGTLITNVEIDDSQPIIPQSEILISNYPNPFNATTIIAFTIPHDLTNSNVELKIYDVQGRLVKSLVNDQLPAGNYLTKWVGDNNSGTTVTSGVYFYSLNVADRNVNGKMIMLK